MKEQKLVNLVMTRIQTASDIVKEFENSERVKRVHFTPEEDSFIHKGIKKH